MLAQSDPLRNWTTQPVAARQCPDSHSQDHLILCFHHHGEDMTLHRRRLIALVLGIWAWRKTAATSGVASVRMSLSLSDERMRAWLSLGMGTNTCAIMEMCVQVVIKPLIHDEVIDFAKYARKLAPIWASNTPRGPKQRSKDRRVAPAVRHRSHASLSGINARHSSFSATLSTRRARASSDSTASCDMPNTSPTSI